jgi:proline dehydrogenase
MENNTLNVNAYFLKNIYKTWAIMPICSESSDYIVSMIGKYLSKLDTSDSISILELWPWTWNITEKVIGAFDNVNITCIEKDPTLAKHCTDKFKQYPNISVICDDAIYVDKYIGNNSIDIVISTIPLSLIWLLSTTILKKLNNTLKYEWYLISGQIRSKQNTLYCKYIGALIHKKIFFHIQPIIITVWKKQNNVFYSLASPSMQPRWIQQKIFRLWELLWWIQLKRDILPRVWALNAHQVPCSFSYLPIVSSSIDEIDHTVQEYKHLVDTVYEQNSTTWIKNDITIKLYQFWQYDFKAYFETAIDNFIAYAMQRGVFVWIDTSDRVYYEHRNILDETIELFQSFYVKYKQSWGGVETKALLWICVQSYHKRTDGDMEHLITQWYVVRLVKWFYADGDIADRHDVTKHYEVLARKYLMFPWLARLAIATHDVEIIHILLWYISDHNISKEKYELQGFWWIQDQYYVDLIDAGHLVRIYIPYGDFMKFVWRWYKWMDRSRILKRILWFKKL